MAASDQLIDHHTRIDHAEPRCTSHELYKGILDGRARGVFNGKIYVQPDAQQTDARQTSRTLLLSDDAVIDAKPQLEIYADDVRCTHGATIGQLDEEQLFYLRTRGIGREAARGLLTYAFANEVLGRIPIDPLREELEGLLFAPRPGREPSEEER
jgi:Fe-S cluster assembly protein SufD